MAANNTTKKDYVWLLEFPEVGRMFIFNNNQDAYTCGLALRDTGLLGGFTVTKKYGYPWTDEPRGRIA